MTEKPPRRPAIRPALAAGAALLGLALTGAAPAVADDWSQPAIPHDRLITLTHTGCQFLEAENNVEYGFETTASMDCVAINKETGADRLADAAPMRLEAGQYTIRVINRDVPYGVGFWLRSRDPNKRLTETSAAKGLIEIGQAMDFEVDLTPGEYLYSCPINPTLNYVMIVN